MAKRNKREKDAIDNIVDQLDLDGVTQEELFGEGGLVKALTSRILNKALEAEMDSHLGYQKHSSLGYCRYREELPHFPYKPLK